MEGRCGSDGQQVREERSLKSLSDRVRSICESAFDNPGRLYNKQRREIQALWFENIARNIDAAEEALQTGIDMKGNRIRPEQVSQSLIRMCGELSQAVVLTRIEDVCGSSIRTDIEVVLQELKRTAVSIA